MQLLEVKLENRPVRDNDKAAILVAPSLGIAPLATHHPLEEVAAIVQLAAKDIYQVINGTLAPGHQLLEVFESNFSHVRCALRIVFTG